jgi:hypothetical protein
MVETPSRGIHTSIPRIEFQGTMREIEEIFHIRVDTWLISSAVNIGRGCGLFKSWFWHPIFGFTAARTLFYGTSRVDFTTSLALYSKGA